MTRKNSPFLRKTEKVPLMAVHEKILWDLKALSSKAFQKSGK